VSENLAQTVQRQINCREPLSRPNGKQGFIRET
jgi:hypothetical protein